MSGAWWLKSVADVGIIAMLVALYRARIRHSRTLHRTLDEIGALVKAARPRPRDRIM